MSPTVPSLERQARSFARDVSDLLNGTVAVGQSIGSVLTPDGSCVVGRGVTRSNFVAQPVPLAVRRKAIPRAHLLVYHAFQLDEDGRWLTSVSSSYALYLTETADEEPLFRYDYQRGPEDPYPEAHFHIRAESADFGKLLERAERAGDGLGDLHFPVGGRRFRPSLEDVVEFLIVERLVEAHSGWRSAVATHRERWEKRQLQAAVRRHSDWAREELDRE